MLVNQRIMTWFLWHLTVMVGLAHLLLALDARALLPEPLSGAWWATRPLWALALLALTGVVVLVMGRFEEPQADDRPAPALWKPILAAVTVIAGLAVMANVGVVSERRDLVVAAVAGSGDVGVRGGACESREAPHTVT